MNAAESLALVARRPPGRLFLRGLARIRERLLALQGGSGAASDGLELRRVLPSHHEVTFQCDLDGRGGQRSASEELSARSSF